MKTSTLVLAGFSAVSAALLSVEFLSFYETQHRGAQTSLGISTPFSVAASYDAVQKNLHSCDKNLSLPNSDFQSLAALTKTSSICAELAHSVIFWMPTHGFAHLIAARAAHFENEPGEMAHFLQKSLSFAPHEGWLAERRFTLLANRSAPDAVPTADIAAADIATLLTTQSGSELLAAYYLHRPEMRPVITQTALHANARNQRRLVNQLQRQRDYK